MRRASVLAEGQNLGAGGIHFRRACEVLTVSIKITTPFGVVIFMARGDNPNPLRSFAIFLEKHPNGLLAGGAFAPYKRFATGKTLAQGEFTSPEYFNHRRVERPTGAKPKRKCDLSKQVAFSFGTPEGTRTPSLQNRNQKVSTTSNNFGSIYLCYANFEFPPLFPPLPSRRAIPWCIVYPSLCV